ncbi:hypothetical protein KEM55_002303 [Ascosphaera atra]|nr:hypothetical protein KEM55_002303 [Ascosphaera atra]
MSWSNTTTAAFPPSSLPPLPSYTLTPREPILAPLPDGLTILIPPVVVYWVVSLFFHFIDVYDLFPQYRLHTPLELLQRNHVSRHDVVRDVLLQQVIQTIVGAVVTLLDEPEYVGREEYDVAVWALRLRKAQQLVPYLLGLVGLDAVGLGKKVAGAVPALAGVLMGGWYPDAVTKTAEGDVVPGFAGWELSVAYALYWYLVPALQFFVAVIIVDSWQYFLHRAMHTNKWLYNTFHSRHHRLYVPYAFGALYNHPFEGFLLDTLGTGIAYLVTCQTPRQAVFFFCGSTIKTIDDHCGYSLPFDPLQLITSNNAAYHDIHHQSWGIKTNFAQPFFTFWDSVLGTRWKGDMKGVELQERYLRERKRAEERAKVGLGSWVEREELRKKMSLKTPGGKENVDVNVKVNSVGTEKGNAKGVVVSEKLIFSDSDSDMSTVAATSN